MQAQDGNEAPRISGYLNNSTQFAATHPDLLEETLWQNVAYQRLNIDWRIRPYIRMEVGIRNLLHAGNATALSYIKEDADKDRGWADLSWNLFSRKNMLYHLNIDRCSFQWTRGAWEVKAGRQRINWGQTLVWNPINIFNPYSFFRIYYPEHPGCDAIRTTYYHNATAYSELAASLDRYGKPTAAFLHNRQINNLEYRLMGGVYQGSDAVIGGGLTSGQGRLIVRAEGSYFHPLTHNSHHSEVLQIAAGADYVFTNNLIIQGEVLYRNHSTDTHVENLLRLYESQQSAKSLSVSKWSILAQALCPVTPRFSVRLSAAYFVDKRLSYAALSLSYRISKNMEASLFSHFLNHGVEEPIKIRGESGSLQYKWNF